jgi:predicted NBD/HSP70 family sugar kinase
MMSGSKAMYLQKVKEQNMSKILHRIWQRGAVSRVELVELTGLTSGTVTNLTQELIGAGLIYESETTSGTVGRKRVMLRYNPDRYRIMGLDIGRSSFEVVLTDFTGRVLASSEGSTVGIGDPEKVLGLIAPQLESMKTLAAKQGCPVIGLGVGIPGPMDIERGVLYRPPGFPGWEGYPVRDALTAKFGLKTWIEDDAHTSALAERWFGLGKSNRDLVFVTMGMGIGGGMVSNGEIVRGMNGLYGQVGHMTLVPGGEKCACGNEGCWETVGSIPGILRRWSGGDRIEDFFLAVRSGEAAATACFGETIYMLESALTNLFHLYDPDVIVLGGKLYPYFDEYLGQIRSRVKERVFAFARERVRIEPSTFGSSQNAVGAAALVFGKLLKEPLAFAELWADVR